jgi:hypothetical protein
MTPSERDEEQRLRRVLQAAAARPDEVPEPGPFLIPKLRARIDAARKTDTAPHFLAGLGALSWRVVPALALVLALLAVWTGFETARADRAQDDASSVLIEPQDLVPDGFEDEAVEPREGRP